MTQDQIRLEFAQALEAHISGLQKENRKVELLNRMRAQVSKLQADILARTGRKLRQWRFVEDTWEVPLGDTTIKIKPGSLSTKYDSFLFPFFFHSILPYFSWKAPFWEQHISLKRLLIVHCKNNYFFHAKTFLLLRAGRIFKGIVLKKKCFRYCERGCTVSTITFLVWIKQMAEYNITTIITN